MTPEFARQLQDFRNYAFAINREFGRAIDGIVALDPPPGLGLAPTEVGAQVSTADKIGNFVETIAKSYLDSMGAYYETIGKVAQLKAAATGGIAVQAVNSGIAVSTSFQRNPLPWLAGGALVIWLVTRR